LGASGDAGLEINAENTKYVMSHLQNSGQNQNIKTANELSENMGMTLTNQNDIHYEIKSRMYSGKACY
jgi:hypothetical protein